MKEGRSFCPAAFFFFFFFSLAKTRSRFGTPWSVAHDSSRNFHSDFQFRSFPKKRICDLILFFFLFSSLFFAPPPSRIPRTSSSTQRTLSFSHFFSIKLQKIWIHFLRCSTRSFPRDSSLRIFLSLFSFFSFFREAFTTLEPRALPLAPEARVVSVRQAALGALDR